MSPFLNVALAILVFAAPRLAHARDAATDLEALSSAAEGPVVEARIHFLRSNSITAALTPFVIRKGLRNLATLPGRRSHVSIELTEGQHKIQILCSGDCGLRKLKFSAHFSGGREYYFLLDPAYKRKGDVDDALYFVEFTSQLQQISRDDYLRLVAEYDKVKTL